MLTLSRSSEAHLRSLFNRFGLVQTCIVNTDKRHAFIKMITRNDAINARDGMESYRTGDMQLRVSFTESTRQQKQYLTYIRHAGAWDSGRVTAVTTRPESASFRSSGLPRQTASGCLRPSMEEAAEGRLRRGWWWRSQILRLEPECRPKVSVFRRLGELS